MLADLDWLNGLARRLVQDPALADDAVQETWMAARRRLHAQGETRQPDRGLLGRTLHGIVLQARRAARRRRYHETTAASARGSGIALPSTSELLLIGERQQVLWNHLADLAEPFRTTLLLHYQRGLDTAIIAEHLGVKPDTVRWRLRRGLELLRSAVDRDSDAGGLMALAPLAALSLPTAKVAALAAPLSLAATGPALSVALMTHKLLLFSAALVMTLLAALWWLPKTTSSANEIASTPGATSPALAAGVDSAAPALLADGSFELRPSERRDAVEPSAVPSSRLAQSTAYGRLIDTDGFPVEGGVIRLRQNEAWEREGRSGPDGRFEVLCPIQDQPVVQLKVPPFGYYRGAFRTLGRTSACSAPPLTMGRVDVGDLVLESGAHVVGRLVGGAGKPVGGESVRIAHSFLRTTSSEDGTFEFHGLDPKETVLVVEPLLYENRILDVALQPRQVHDLGDVLLASRPLLAVRGRVLDPSGKPVPGAQVVTPATSAATGQDGRFELLTPTSGRASAAERARVWAEAAGYRRSNWAYCEDQSNSTIVIHPLGQEVRCVVADASSENPIEGAQIRLRERPGLDLSGDLERYAAGSAGHRSGPDGRLAFRGLPDVDLVHVSAPGYVARDLLFADAAGQEGELVLLLAPEPRGIVRGVVPPSFAGAADLAIEVQDLERLASPLAGEGSSGKAEPADPAWIAPPPHLHPQRSGADALLRWVNDLPTLRTINRHTVHGNPDGSFRWLSDCQSMQRVVVHAGERVAVSEPFWAGAQEEVTIQRWNVQELGTLSGAVLLPHPALASEIQLVLSGHDSPALTLDAQGHFTAEGIVPGTYILDRGLLPDGLGRAPFLREVEIRSGSITQVEIDAGSAPYGSVEFTLSLNGNIPPGGYDLYLNDGSSIFYGSSEKGAAGLATMLVPAATGYLVSVEPEIHGYDISEFELPLRIDIVPGDQRIHLEVDTARLVCDVGERLHPALEKSWQMLHWKDAAGIERTPIQAGLSAGWSIRPNAGRRSIEVDFPFVPLEAQDLRLEFRAYNGETIPPLPLKVQLSPGETSRAQVD